MTFEPSGFDADLTDIRASYLERGGRLWVLVDEARAMIRRAPPIDEDPGPGYSEVARTALTKDCCSSLQSAPAARDCPIRPGTALPLRRPSAPDDGARSA